MIAEAARFTVWFLNHSDTAPNNTGSGDWIQTSEERLNRATAYRLRTPERKTCVTRENVSAQSLITFIV